MKKEGNKMSSVTLAGILYALAGVNAGLWALDIELGSLNLGVAVFAFGAGNIYTAIISRGK